ncbi:MAG: glycosyltransferase family 2 protein [Chitinophagaceae bacterium]|jgi:glycosyltransferase involved in cell wall biosynthesis
MNISVVIPTYNGGHKILNLLKSLENQTKLPNEVIVVIDGSTDNTVEVLKNSSFTLPGFQVHYQENGGRAKVRNSGARLAGGDLLIFFDDDMELPENCIQAHYAHHIQYKKGLMCGALHSPHKNSANDFLRFQSWLSDKWQESYFKNKEKVVLVTNPYFTAADFSILKNDFASFGYFDERLNDLEDYDLAIRLLSDNYPIYINSDAWAYHVDTGSQNVRNYIKRLRQYYEAQKLLISIKPEIYADPDKNERYVAKPTGLKAAFFNFLATNFWIDAVDKNRITWLPQKIRYKIYDFIITANSTMFPQKVKLK